MLQKTYSIYSDSLDNNRLFVEAGKNHVACWCRGADENKLTAFELFQCDSYTGASFDNMMNAAKLHSRLLTMQPASAKFILNTNEAMCIPRNNNYATGNFIEQNLELLFGSSTSTNILTAEYKDYWVAARIDENIQRSLQSAYPGVQFYSQYACLLPSLFENGKTDIAYLFFYPYYFSLIIFREGKLQFLQTRAYSNAEDVLYCILNVFRQYDIDTATEIFTGGFIDAESKLYQTLYQYLEGLRTAEVDEALFASDEFKDYSSHYFLPYANYEV